MKIIWNLVAACVLLFIILIDCLFLGIDYFTILNSFISGANFIIYIADRLLNNDALGRVRE